MRRRDGHTDGGFTRARLRLSALLRRPWTGRIDSAEAAAFDAAAREAYRQGTHLEQRLPAAIDPTTPPPPLAKDARDAGPKRPAPNVSAVRTRPFVARAEPVEPRAVADPSKADDPGPDPPLGTRTSVTPVADDFFDGLIRRVEGDG
jgi:hypothetical protein